MTDAATAATPGPSLMKLQEILDGMGEVAVAVSGGVDSLTLAVVAHGRLGSRAKMYHALSPAVPARATARVRRQALRRGWDLEMFDAGEFADPRYRANPSNRCYFCKTNLYRTVSSVTRRLVISGTNTDDLGDYRPGLLAASEQGVRHPYVEVGIDKATVRVIARELGLGEVAELPASPCLSSRIETGLPIESPVLQAVDRAEEWIEQWLGQCLAQDAPVRCRVRGEGVVVELDKATIQSLGQRDRALLVTEVARRLQAAGVEREVTIAPYTMGSAFLRDAGDGGESAP